MNLNVSTFLERKATSMDIFTEDIPNGDISVPVSTVSLTDYTSYPLNSYFSMETKMSLPSSQSMQYHIGIHSSYASYPDTNEVLETYCKICSINTEPWPDLCKESAL